MAGRRDRPHEAAAIIIKIQIVCLADQQSAVFLNMNGDVQVLHRICLAGIQRNARHAHKQQHRHDAGRNEPFHVIILSAFILTFILDADNLVQVREEISGGNQTLRQTGRFP